MVSAVKTVTVVIPDYDEAIAWYTEVLGFRLVEDTPLNPGKRWVVVAPAAGATGSAFLLAKAATEQQSKTIGNQTGGRVAFFLQTDNFQTDYHRLKSAGVHFLETPRQEPYGQVVQFTDPWGNKYDLIEYTTPLASEASQSQTPSASEAQPSPEQKPNSLANIESHKVPTIAPLASEASQPQTPPASEAQPSPYLDPKNRSPENTATIEAQTPPASEAQPSLEPHPRDAAKPSATADARSGDGRAAQHSGSYVSSAAVPATKQMPGNRLRRFGFVGIIVPVATHQGPEIQRILSDHADLIQGRMGLPHLENDTLSVITLIVHATPDQLGSLTGRLGRLPGITVKSGLAPQKDEA